eukprot:m.226650 g.226650  ORF g.226650 m.226650 type:complete len:1689 (+) comp33499_c0_seq1:264-5330(+)
MSSNITKKEKKEKEKKEKKQGKTKTPDPPKTSQDKSTRAAKTDTVFFEDDANFPTEGLPDGPKQTDWVDSVIMSQTDDFLSQCGCEAESDEDETQYRRFLDAEPGIHRGPSKRWRNAKNGKSIKSQSTMSTKSESSSSATSRFGKLVGVTNLVKKLATPKAHEETEPTTRLFRETVYEGDNDHQKEEREKHRGRLGDDFFGAFDQSDTHISRQFSSRVRKTVSAKNIVQDALRKRLFTDTLATRPFEKVHRGNHTYDDVYQAAVHAIVLGDPTNTDLLTKAQEVFGVDQNTHAATVTQMSTIANAFTTGMVLKIKNLTVQTSGVVGEEIVCMLQVFSTESQSTPNPQLDEKLVKKAKHYCHSLHGQDLEDMRQLLNSGANPNAYHGHKRSAMDRARDLEDIPLLTLLNEYGGIIGTTRKGIATYGKSSGRFETTPIKTEEDRPGEVTVVFPDNFVIPLINGTASALHVEVWSVNNNTAIDAIDEDVVYDEADVVVAPAAEKKRRFGKRVKRKSLFGRRSRASVTPIQSLGRSSDSSITSTSSALSSTSSLGFEPTRNPTIDKGGVRLTLLGSVAVDLAIYEEEIQYTPKLSPEDRGLPEVDRAVQQICFCATISSNLTLLKREARKLHQYLSYKFLRHAAAHARDVDQNKCAEDYVVVYRGQQIGPMLQVIDLHAEKIGLSPEETALDQLCSLLELHGKLGVSPKVIKQSLVAFKRVHSTSYDCESDDRGRLIVAIESAVTSWLNLASHPHDFFDLATDVGKIDLACCIEALQIAFSVEEWSKSTACSAVDASAVGDSRMQFLRTATAMMETAIHPTYLRIKNALQDKFGSNLYEQLKIPVQEMLSRTLKATQTYVETDKLPEGEVMARMDELLAKDTKGALTYSRVKSVLEKEFGLSVVASYRKTISSKLIMEMNSRVKNPNAEGVARSLDSELRLALEVYVRERYVRLQASCSPADENYSGKDFVVIKLLMDRLTLEVESSHEFAPYYNVIPGFDFMKSYFSWMDKLIAADLKTILASWRPMASEPDFPYIFFQLLKSTRELWDALTDAIDEKGRTGYRLVDYPEWFYPFVQNWLKECKIKAMVLVHRAVDLDDWQPITKANVVSASSRDVLRIMYEIVDNFNRINWPDKEALEQSLFVLLCDAVCGSAEAYVKRVEADIRLPDSKTTNNNVFFSYLLDDDVCIRLNDLEEISKKFKDIFTYMGVAKVAETHRLRAIENNKGHRGRIIVHKSTKLFQNTGNFIQERILSICKDVGMLMTVQLERDIRMGVKLFSKSDHVVDFAHAILTRSLVQRDDYLDELQNSDRMDLFNSKALQSAKSRLLEDRPGMKQDGFLMVNLCLLVTKSEHAETAFRIVLSVWIQFNMILSEVLAQQPFYSNKSPNWLELVMALKDDVLDFLNDDGEGLSLELLQDTCDATLIPVANCYTKTTEALISFYYLQAAISQSFPFSEFMAEESSEDRNRKKTYDPTRASKLRPTTDADIDSTQAVVLQTTTDAAEQSVLTTALGKIKLSFSRLPDRGTMRINVLSGRNLRGQNVFVTAKTVPTSEASVIIIPAGKEFKSTLGGATSNPSWHDQGFTIRYQDTAAAAIEVRVYRKRNAPLANIVVGETLLDLQSISLITDNSQIEFPLSHVVQGGLLGQIQQILKKRAEGADPLAKAFAKRLGLNPRGSGLLNIFKLNSQTNV